MYVKGARTKSFKEAKAGRNNLPTEKGGQELQCKQEKSDFLKNIETLRKHPYLPKSPTKSKGKIGFFRQANSEVIHHPHIYPARNGKTNLGARRKMKKVKYWGSIKKGSAL